MAPVPHGGPVVGLARVADIRNRSVEHFFTHQVQMQPQNSQHSFSSSLYSVTEVAQPILHLQVVKSGRWGGGPAPSQGHFLPLRDLRWGIHPFGAPISSVLK